MTTALSRGPAAMTAREPLRTHGPIVAWQRRSREVSRSGQISALIDNHRARGVRCRASPEHRIVGAVSSHGLGVVNVAATTLSIRLVHEYLDLRRLTISLRFAFRPLVLLARSFRVVEADNGGRVLECGVAAFKVHQQSTVPRTVFSSC